MPHHPFALARHAGRPAPVPPLPHPSWRGDHAAAARHGTQIEPEEFWQRLGL
ncbi:hypothetical protein [Novosphingobium rosa]|uniref:hypothetical protein n=1 Tax=Novosphingobium rosa TaxID=76978 RepID=UPI000A92EF0E|nr:hypothetical protein [Novosphingobium rosa]